MGHVEGVVEPHSLVKLLEDLLRGENDEAPRSSISLGGSWLGAMVAGGMGYFSAKIVGVYPENPGRGLPLVRGVLLLFRGSDGEKLLDIPAEEPTGWRTAAASALALSKLGFRGGGVLGVIGAGVQARYHLRVLLQIFRFDEILVASRRMETGERLAREFGGRRVGRRDLLRRSDVVVAATNSREPVVEGDFLRSGAYVVSVGAPRPVRELDDSVKRRASCILVDSAIACEESDDACGVEAVTLRDYVRGAASCRWGDVYVYKSVGTPLFDLAIAIHIYERLSGRGKVSTSSSE
ncbi:ornithine cyclodeaminase family protein [Aeropyrum camini]|uniref:Ornithine cyclodeaminase n=1 Tax=Aeropyrum camini SY1 = JCM 12091 TaxID=1198449 RepID=U3TDL4_9CREN|nr:ornithine cyclodeaminase family protein [Aeropyrum camini]BAN90068.1 ornithine cyclodeaminase [Aeropyrum camini SY1 = JCM 12091]